IDHQVRGDQEIAVLLTLHGLGHHLGELLEGVGLLPRQEDDRRGPSRGQREGWGARGERPPGRVHHRADVRDPEVLGARLRGLLGRVPGVLALPGREGGRAVGPVAESRERTEGQREGQGRGTQSPGQGGEERLLRGHEPTSCGCAADGAGASRVPEVWPSPPYASALRVSQPCLFMVTKAKALIGSAMRMTTSTTTGSRRISCGCLRRWEIPRMPRVRISHATGARMPTWVRSTRLSSRYAMVMPIVSGVM